MVRLGVALGNIPAILVPFQDDQITDRYYLKKDKKYRKVTYLPKKISVEIWSKSAPIICKK